MDLILGIVSLFLVFFIGYLSEENKSYFLTISLFLIPSGILMGYFFEEIYIYTLLLLFGILMERSYSTYKWPVSKKPKTADYKRVSDWLMKIIFTILIIISIELVSDTNIFFNFVAFFGGVLISNSLKVFEKKRD